MYLCRYVDSIYIIFKLCWRYLYLYGTYKAFLLQAEADALLMVDTDEDEIKKPEEIIDWNEIDNILNQN